jgi:hypothetical protein
MFSNLSKNSIIYGVNQTKNMQVFAAFIDHVTPPYTRYSQGRLPEIVVDIVATVNGEHREFKQVPSSTSIANFGDDSFVLADSKDSLNAYLQSMLQNSINIVASADKHKPLIPQYKKAINDLNPNMSSNEENANEVKALREEVGSLKGQLAEAIALLKSGNMTKTNE